MCTLFPGDKKLVVSVFFRINYEGEVLGEPRFKRSIVKNVAKMSYDEAEFIIKQEDDQKFIKNFLNKHKISNEKYEELA
jgi:exoribonuclease R